MECDVDLMPMPGSPQVSLTATEAEVLSSLNALSLLPLVAQLTSNPVMITDLLDQIVWVNEAFVRISGWKLNEVAGRQPQEFLHGPLTDPGTVKQLREHVAVVQSFQCEIQNYRRDGSTFWISLDAQPILDPDGKLRGYLSVHNNITAQKDLEAALQKKHRLLEAVSVCLTDYLSSENLHAAFDNLLKQLLSLTNSHFGFIGEVLFDSSNSPRLKSLSVSNPASDSNSPLLRETDRNQDPEFSDLLTRFGDAITNGESVIQNSPMTDSRRGGRASGRPDWHRFLGIPIVRANRLVGLIGLANCPESYSQKDVQFLQPLVMAIGQLIDTNRRDSQRREMERSLRQTEEWLEETGRVAEIGAWQIDIETMTLRWSSQTHRIHEVPADFIPDVNTAINFYDPEARPIIREAVARALADGTPWDLELPLTTATGRPRWVRAMGHAVFEDNKVTRIFGAFNDVTERRRANVEKEKLQVQFAQSQKMESVGRLAGGIAHDFNNMLAVILGHSEMMTLDETLTAKHRVHIKAIMTAGRRSAELTQQLLAFARRQNAAPQKVDVNKTLKRMLDLLKKSMGGGIELEWMPGDDVWAISIDPVQLDQILANLCMNARDAIADSGRILLSTRNETLAKEQRFRSSELPPGDYVVLTVSDNGCGMSESTLQHLFEPFNSTKPVGAGLGPGLGLATVYGIVHQNSGSIDVESDRSIGTTVRIYLPRSAQGAPESILRNNSVALSKRLTILLVEDEPALLKIGRLSLKQLGYKVYSATNSREALQMMQSHGRSIDVVVADVVLPGGNGWKLAREIQEMHDHIRFVFMSGYGDQAIPNAGTAGLPFPVLSKPFDFQQLASAIEAAVFLGSGATSQDQND